MEIPKISRRRPTSVDDAELGHFTLLFCRGRQRNVQRIITHVHSYIVLLIKPFVWWRSLCRRRRGLLKFPIGKTTTTNQCKRVPDLWRPGSVKIKRYCTKNGRLIPTAKRGKEMKQLWSEIKTSTIYLPDISVWNTNLLRGLKQNEWKKIQNDRYI